MFRVYANLTTVLDLVGRREEAVLLAFEGIEVAGAVGMDAVYGNFLRGNVAESLYRLGRWREAAEFSTRGLEWDPRGPIPIVSPLSLATVAIESAADDAAARMVGRLLVDLETIRDPQFAVPTYLAAASLALWRGDCADAVRAADRAWDEIRGNEDWVMVARVAASWTETAATAGWQIGPAPSIDDDGHPPTTGCRACVGEATAASATRASAVRWDRDERPTRFSRPRGPLSRDSRTRTGRRRGRGSPRSGR